MIIEIIEDHLDKDSLNHITPNIGARGVFFLDGKLCILHYEKTHRYTLPGGGVEENESLEDAIKREVLEETGYEVISFKPTVTLKEYFKDSIWHHHYFYCEVNPKAKGQSLTKEELDHKLNVTFKTLDEAIDIFAFQESDNRYQSNINKRELLGLMHSLPEDESL